MAKQIPAGERDLGRVVATVRQLTNEGAALDTRLTTAEADIDTLEAAVDALEAVTHREVLTADRTYYVRSADGSDSNNGLANTSGGAFATMQKAVNTVASIDLASYSVTIQLVGNFTETPILKSYVGAGPVIILGDETTPSNVTITGTGSNAGIFVADGVVGRWDVRGVKLTSSVSGQPAFRVVVGSTLKFQKVDFGSINSAAQISVADGGIVEATDIYSITGGGTRHVAALHGAVVRLPTAVTLTGTPAFTTYAVAQQGSTIRMLGASFTGSATGARYLVDTVSSIATGGLTLPGNAAGTATAASYGAYT